MKVLNNEMKERSVEEYGEKEKKKKGGGGKQCLWKILRLTFKKANHQTD